jgi:hypothetical protein
MYELSRAVDIDERSTFSVPREYSTSQIVDCSRTARFKVPGNPTGE